MTRFYFLGHYSAIFLLGFTAYAIVKHELMGIKTLLTQVLIVVISIILLIDVILLSNNFTMQLLKIGVLLTFLYFSRELVKSVKREREARSELEKANKQINNYVDELEIINNDLTEKNEDLKALLEASGKAMEALDPKKIAQDIVDSIPKSLKHMGCLGGIISLYDEKTKMIMTYAITESKIVKRAKAFLGKQFEEYAQHIDEADNFTVKTIKEKKIYTGSRLSDFIAPTVNKNICNLIQGTVRAKSFISIPLISRGVCVGVIIFVGKKTVSEIIQRDKDTLYMFSSHIGGAMENARLYEQTNSQLKALAILNENLKHANENMKELIEMKNEFLHITSHQLRTPLTAIRGMLSMWVEGDYDNMTEEKKKEMMQRIYLSTERLNNITNDMLDTLELEGEMLMLQLSPVSIENIIQETIDTLKPNYDKKGLYVKLNKEDNLPQVKAEPNYIRQVFMNVIDNACKYTLKGGVEITIKRNGNHIDTIIKDTGIGIPKQDQNKLFQKFTRGSNAVKTDPSGSGLGLFIAKMIVERHNGKIEFRSEGIGKGTEVRIELRVG